jgi:hypothetical protein
LDSKEAGNKIMVRRLTSLTVVVGAVVCGLIALIRTKGPLAQLRIVRFAIEQGKPVVFFQVEGAKGRRLAIFNVVKIEGDGTLVQKPSGSFAPASDFWAPNQTSPLGISDKGRSEFGVIAPSIAVWKLRVTLDVEDQNSFRKLFRLSGLWEVIGRAPLRTLRDLAASIWHENYSHPEFVESELITNAVAFDREVAE